MGLSDAPLFEMMMAAPIPPPHPAINAALAESIAIIAVSLISFTSFFPVSYNYSVFTIYHKREKVKKNFYQA